MSKRHQSSRRRSYGRRQHELHEREGGRHQLPDAPDNEAADPSPASASEPFSFMEPRATRLRLMMGE